MSSAPAPAPKEIWTKDENISRSQWLSFLVHASVGALFVIPLTSGIDLSVVEAKTSRVAVVDLNGISPYQPRTVKAQEKAKGGDGGGGGGERNPIPASKGRTPRFTLRQQLVPPRVITDPNIRMPLEATLFGSPDIKIPQPNLPNYGDPLAPLLNDSSGPGWGGGGGSGKNGGVGSGDGPGLGPGADGGAGGGRHHPGEGGIGYPECVYCPNPPYTEEARKARFQGVVLLEIVVLPDGRASEVHVLRGVGMGLDESEEQTVGTWRFKPLIGPGNHPVAVETPVEVTFRLF